jgi:hypothetical protein
MTPTPVRLVLLGLLAGLLGACVGPTPTVDSYREHAAGALLDMGEVAATLQLVAENAAADDLTDTFATVLVREQEEKASYAHSAFATRQPPEPADDLRARVLHELDAGVSLAEEARILADRGELAQLGALAARFRDLHTRLTVLEEQVRDDTGPGTDGRGA